MKVRLQGRDDQFGWTWNGSTRRWVSSNSSWSLQTTITANASGGARGWLTARAGSRTASASETTASLCVVLRREGTDSNVLLPETRAVVLLPFAPGGIGLLHGPVSSPLQPEAVLPVAARDSVLENVGLALAEPNEVDDDDNGIVDDELLPGSARSFRIAVPSSRLLSLQPAGGVVLSNLVAFGGVDLPVSRPDRPRAVTLNVRPQLPTYGDRAVLSGRLDGSGEETLCVDSSSDGLRWTTASYTRTSGEGFYAITASCRRTLRYRVAWLGTPTCAASVSRPILLAVTPRLSARLSKPLVRANQRFVVLGSFYPFKAGRALKILLIGAGGRRTEIRRSLSSTRFAYPIRVRRRGTYRVIVLFEGDKELARRWVQAGRLRVI